MNDELLAKLNAIAKQYGVIVRSQIRGGWRVELFDGEPCISGGVGEVSGWVEYHGKGQTIEAALDEAIRKEKEGLTLAKEHAALFRWTEKEDLALFEWAKSEISDDRFLYDNDV
jgi:hypothetical protein